MNKKTHFEKNTTQKLEVDVFSINYLHTPYLNRESERYDFTDEWNNLGYGKIRNDVTKWSISISSTSHINFTHVLAHVVDRNKNILCDYCGIIEKNNTATLWFNREVGPIDGVDYYIVEDFLTNYKIEKLGSQPILSEIPFGYKSAVTMRIDCDEEIASGRKLFELYNKKNIPFSLAIKTSIPFSFEHIKMMNDVINSGGAVVSHSHSHANNWGNTREQAKWEAETAKASLKKILPKNYSLDYVVSPFHQNPKRSLDGLVDAGIKGFIGGIIKNDPDYLQARAGYVTTKEDIFTHSQQCMFHGDCFHDTGLDIYKKSYKNHYNTNTFFGFLDHPFSNYKY
ncbi:MAG: hypothetical protein ACJAS4_002303, partial [Bacteriovoracaceae bacterium]